MPLLMHYILIVSGRYNVILFCFYCMFSVVFFMCIILQNLRTYKAFNNFIKPKLLEVQTRISMTKAHMLTSAMWREFSESPNFAIYTVEEPEEESNVVVRPSPRGPMVSVDLLPMEKQSRSKNAAICSL